MNIKELGEKYIWAQTEAWMKGNVDAFDEIETHDVIFHSLPGEPLVGIDGHKQHVADFRKAFAGLKMEPEYLGGEGKFFGISGKCHMRLTEQLPGMPPPTGKEISGALLFFCRTKKDKVVEVWSIGNFQF
jgi:predicted ester cyclase